MSLGIQASRLFGEILMRQTVDSVEKKKYIDMNSTEYLVTQQMQLVNKKQSMDHKIKYKTKQLHIKEILCFR